MTVRAYTDPKWGSVSLKGTFFTAGYMLSPKVMADVETAIATFGQQQVLANLAGSLQHPTGYYQGQVIVDRSASDQLVVTDQGVPYGPWLEGTGSRNSSTRFKGYQSFRRARATTNDRAVSLASAVIADVLKVLNS